MRHQKSIIETYHIVNRGVNNMNIFRKNEDKEEFLKLIQKGSVKYGVTILAYCLMDNHYHLLLKADIGKYSSISGLLRYTNSQYVRYYNKTDTPDEEGDMRSGTLFRGSYKGVPVNNRLQTEKVIAYIHNNPVPLMDNIETYEYSSYHRYLRVLGKEATAEEENAHGIALDFFVLSHYSVDELRKTTKESSKYKLFEGKKDYVGKNYLTDELLSDEIKDRFGVDTSDIKNMNAKEKGQILFELDKMPGTSRKQLERVLAIDYAQICRLIREYKRDKANSHLQPNGDDLTDLSDGYPDNVATECKENTCAEFGDGSP